VEALLDTKDAAKLLAVSEAFLERARWAGEPAIPFIRVGSRAVRYSPAALEQYIRNRQSTVSGGDVGSDAPVRSMQQMPDEK
jgi:hypothetical protein